MSTDSSLGEMQKLMDVLTDIHGDTYDVTIVCSDGNELTANQIILCWASEVFEAMFRNKMEESATKTVNITDISSDTMEIILDFLASGQLPGLDELLDNEMIYALEKYDFKCMKKAIAAKFLDTDAEHLWVSYELLTKLNMQEGKKRLANRMALHFRSLHLDQLKRLDSDAFLWISQSLKDQLGSSHMKAGNETRKDVWTNFVKIYTEWMSTVPVDAAKHVEKVMQTVELHLLDVQTIQDLFSKSPVLHLISPWMSAIVKRLMGLEADQRIQRHMRECTVEIQCPSCAHKPDHTLHAPGWTCPLCTVRCPACNQELTYPPPTGQNSATQAGVLTGWSFDLDSFSS